MEINKQKPKISVIIPTYNREKVLPRAVKSVLNQTFKDFEILVVDDGSIDNTQEVVEDLQKKDRRIRYFRYTPNQGGNVARNLGIKKAYGRYITFLDSDDEYYKNNLERRYKVSQNLSSSYQVIFNQCVKKTSLGNKVLPKRGFVEGESAIRYLFLKRNEIQTNLLFIDKNIIEKYNLFFDEELKRHQDWDIAIRLKEKTNFYFLREVLSVWHDETQEDRVSKQKDYSASFYLIKKHKDKFEQEKDVLSKFYCRIGVWHLQQNQIKEARKLFLDSIKNKPYIKSLFLYFSTFLGKKFVQFLFKLLNYKNKSTIQK
jgi:glycosyltransferase involved in cell wall biosynthesis